MYYYCEHSFQGQKQFIQIQTCIVQKFEVTQIHTYIFVADSCNDDENKLDAELLGSPILETSGVSNEDNVLQTSGT